MKNDLDELQVSIRTKIASQSLGIIMIMTLINGIVNEKFVWATPTTQSYIIVMITISYFTIMTTLKGAHMSDKDKNSIFIVIFSGILVIISIYSLVHNFSRFGMGYIVKDNMLTDSSIGVCMSILWTSWSLINLYKFIKNRKLKDE